MNSAALAAATKGDLNNFLVAVTPGGIEKQEAQGQKALVESTNMPINLHGQDDLFIKLGFTLGDPIDEVFRAAILPAGWSRKATDHSMHSVILDDKGRERVRVFYKAAFYDRRANAYLTPRYSFTWLFPPHEGEEPNGLAADELVYAVFDCGKEIKRFTPTKTDDWEANNAQKAIGEVWMSDNFPLSGDPLAYWD